MVRRMVVGARKRSPSAVKTRSSSFVLMSMTRPHSTDTLSVPVVVWSRRHGSRPSRSQRGRCRMSLLGVHQAHSLDLLVDASPEGCFHLVRRGRRFPRVQKGDVVSALESNRHG